VRTTLTIDPDVARLLDSAVRREGRPMKQVINDALRRALRPQQPGAVEVYHLTPHQATLRAGFDLTGFNRLADELEDEEILDQVRHDHDRS
jgi:hypothetical protein